MHLILFYIVEHIYSTVRTACRSFISRLRCGTVSRWTRKRTDHPTHTARVVDGTCREVKRVDSCNLFPLITVHEIRKCTSVSSVFAMYTFFIFYFVDWYSADTHNLCSGVAWLDLDLVVEYAECDFFVIFPSSRRQMLG
jgi:hypothetical protein